MVVTVASLLTAIAAAAPDHILVIHHLTQPEAAVGHPHQGEDGHHKEDEASTIAPLHERGRRERKTLQSTLRSYSHSCCCIKITNLNDFMAVNTEVSLLLLH